MRLFDILPSLPYLTKLVVELQKADEPMKLGNFGKISNVHGIIA